MSKDNQPVEQQAAPEEYKGACFDTIEGAWDWHSRAIPETVYCSDELTHLLGEEIMFKRDFEPAVRQLLTEKLAQQHAHTIQVI